MARMAELVGSRQPGDLLVALGLGSCIGVALVDPGTRVAGLAHVVLPSSGGAATGEAAKFADTSVPALVTEMLRLGARRGFMVAAIAGGAKMFAMGGTLDVGARNDQAVRDALTAAGIPLRGSATGGSVGRTVRVYVAEGRVTVKEAGGAEVDLMAATTASMREAA